MADLDPDNEVLATLLSRVCLTDGEKSSDSYDSSTDSDSVISNEEIISRGPHKTITDNIRHTPYSTKKNSTNGENLLEIFDEFGLPQNLSEYLLQNDDYNDVCEAAGLKKSGPNEEVSYFADACTLTNDTFPGSIDKTALNELGLGLAVMADFIPSLDNEPRVHTFKSSVICFNGRLPVEAKQSSVAESTNFPPSATVVTTTTGDGLPKKGNCSSTLEQKNSEDEACCKRLTKDEVFFPDIRVLIPFKKKYKNIKREYRSKDLPGKIMEVSPDQNSCLHEAVNQDEFRMIYSILYYILKTKICDPVQYLAKRNSQGNTPLHLAAMREQVLTCEIFLRKLGATDCQNNAGETALHIAVLAGNLELVKTVFSRSSIETKNLNGCTPLHLAVSNLGESDSNFHIINYLLKQDPDVSIQDSEGETVFHYVVKKKNLRLLKNFLPQILSNCQHIKFESTGNNEQFSYIDALDIKNNSGKTSLNIAQEFDDNFYLKKEFICYLAAHSKDFNQNILKNMQLHAKKVILFHSSCGLRTEQGQI